ncbi:hypothetical protein BDY19DRAFT_942448 [Irpex rosettiformis]|uniref:Uncharacterized protein n=1 Tax=Irpex rosettiformis TaxID=378272 RepID=A0ACB8U5E8_9APHY|nr:hypothetical protein BDY19DRAFT_942448 [Irpex rosettiformis]
MAHVLNEPYSGKNPVPQIATKLTALVNPERATEAKAAQLQDQSDRNEAKQTEKTASRLAKGHVMRVTDPVTGDELDIKNADQEPDLRTAGENVLDTNFPPPDWEKHQEEITAKVTSGLLTISLTYTTCFLLSRLLSNSILSTAFALIVPTIVAYAVNFRIHRLSKIDFDDRAWHSERARGLRAGSDVDGDGKVTGEERTKESAEWANALLRGVWPIMNPDLFSNLVDMLEDIMQASVPHFVHSVRIADMGLGSNAARVTAVQSLPDAHSREFTNKEDEDHQDPEEIEALDEQHVNLELSFAYRGLPSGQSAASKAHNAHLLVEFFPGLRGLYGFRIPVWVEVTGATGTARTRLQLISEPPFVKKAMITLLGLPRITISVVAIHKLLPNIMNLPFISGFISSAIDTAAAEYVAPKSLTLDLQKLISGDDIKKETDATGVIVVHIHRAKDVKRADTTGGSVDPYLTLTYSRLGRPLYSTRIIKGDLNPVFEETAVVLVDVNTIRLREKLSFQLWDSDRLSVDDLLGVAEVDVVDLVRNHATPHRRSTSLSDPQSRHVPGHLEYTVGYYTKRAPTPSLKSDGMDPGIPDDLKDKPEFQNAKETAMNDLEAAVLVTPPDPAWPSGILSVQVHEIRGLGVKTEGREKSVLRGLKSREGEKGQNDDSAELEESEDLPSSYCTISLNDELVYQTRVKPITSTPIFNAGTEHFVRDWRTSHVTVAVKDSRMRENDAILGVVMLKLSDLLVNASQITRLYSLERGLGYGRIRLSLLFRPVEAKLPLNLLGFDTGTLMVHDVSAKLNDDADINVDLSKCQVRLQTSKARSGDKVSRKTGEKRQDGSIVWAANNDQESLKGIPVRSRYGSAFIMSFKDTSSIAGLKRASRKAMAILWLRDLTDNEDTSIEVPLWYVESGDYSRLKMNYSPPDGNLDDWDDDKEGVQRIGTVKAHAVFKPGIGDGHKETMNGGGSKKREAWEAYMREKDGGLRDLVGEFIKDGRDLDRIPEKSSQNRRECEVTSLAEASNDSEPSRSAEESGGRMWTAGSRPDLNTMLSSAAVENEKVKSPAGREEATTNDETGGDDGGKKMGLLQKLKDWKDHEKELHRDHRGLMQMKPVRTAEWVKDNIEEGAHAVKNRFAMKGRKPDVETEV